MLRTRILAAVTVVYLLAVAWITLSPQPQDSAQNHFIRDAIAAVAQVPGFGWVTYDGVEFTANIAMFVPMGVLFTLLLGLRRWWLALLIGIAATCAIELTQQLLPTRYSDPRDIVANSLGALVGIGIVAVLARVRRRTAVAAAPEAVAESVRR